MLAPFESYDELEMYVKDCEQDVHKSLFLLINDWEWIPKRWFNKYRKEDQSYSGYKLVPCKPSGIGPFCPMLECLDVEYKETEHLKNGTTGYRRASYKDLYRYC